MNTLNDSSSDRFSEISVDTSLNILAKMIVESFRLADCAQAQAIYSISQTLFEDALSDLPPESRQRKQLAEIRDRFLTRVQYHYQA